MKTLKNLGIVLIVLTVLAFNPGQVEAQEIQYPDTPAAKMAKAFFEAFNADDMEKMREFTVNNRTEAALARVSIDDRMAQHQQIKGMLKQFEVKKISKSEEKNLVVIAYSEAVESWFEIGFTLNDDNPPLLEGFALKPTTAPSANPEDDGFGEWETLSQLLNNVVEKHGIPGISMAVIQDGKIVDKAVAGIRQVGESAQVELNDRFHIGSATKSMTATLIGKLIEDGKLKASSTLKELFPEVKMRKAYEAATVEQLLTHYSGLPGYLTVTDEEEAKLLALPGNPSEQRLAFTQQVLQEEPIANPGSSFTYSNAGYAVLGTIVEQVTGKSWEQQLDKVIFRPLKMKTAGVGWPKTEKRNNQPAGHFGALNDLTPQTVSEYPLGAYIEPAGDVHTSMEDLAKYALAHLKGFNGEDGILKSETFQMLHAVKENRNYASGWFINNLDGKVVHEHPGSAGTFMAWMMIQPETNSGVVIAANAGGMVLDGIFRKIAQEYRWK